MIGYSSGWYSVPKCYLLWTEGVRNLDAPSARFDDTTGVR